MKVTLLAAALALSLAVNAFLLYVATTIEPKYEVPIFSEAEYEKVKKAYSQIADAGEFPIRSYVQSLDKRENGYSMKVCMLEYLQVPTSVMGGGEIFDGCTCYQFDAELNYSGNGFWC